MHLLTLAPQRLAPQRPEAGPVHPPVAVHLPVAAAEVAAPLAAVGWVAVERLAAAAAEVAAACSGRRGDGIVHHIYPAHIAAARMRRYTS